MRKEFLVTRASRRKPIHPGALLREEVLPALGLTVTGAARRLGVTRQTLHRILAETLGITPEMALRLGKLVGNGPGLWLRMQQEHDLRKAERALGAELRRISPCRQAA